MVYITNVVKYLLLKMKYFKYFIMQLVERSVGLVGLSRWSFSGSFLRVKLMGHSRGSFSWIEFVKNLRLHRISLRYIKQKVYYALL